MNPCQLGPVAQIGIIVEDIDAAMRHWAQACGIGPWFLMKRQQLDAYIYRGEILPPPDVSLAFANSGHLQFELVQQHCHTPSIYRDFLASGPQGMQHWATGPTDYDLAHRWLVRTGHIPVQEASGNRGRLAYFQHPSQPWNIVEINEMTLARQSTYEKIRLAALCWDGENSVRDFSEL